MVDIKVIGNKSFAHMRKCVDSPFSKTRRMILYEPFKSSARQNVSEFDGCVVLPMTFLPIRIMFTILMERVTLGLGLTSNIWRAGPTFVQYDDEAPNCEAKDKPKCGRTRIMVKLIIGGINFSNIF